MYVHYHVYFEGSGEPPACAGTDICHETVRFWGNRIGALVAGDIPKRRLRAGNLSRWHVGGVLVKANGEVHYLWRAVDHEGEVLEFIVSRRGTRLVPSSSSTKP
jgi:putative transposase